MDPSTVYCDRCGAANRLQARFCIGCGQTMPAVSSLPPTVVGSVGSSLIPTVLAAPTTSSVTGQLASNVLLNQRYRVISQLGQGGMGAIFR